MLASAVGCVALLSVALAGAEEIPETGFSRLLKEFEQQVEVWAEANHHAQSDAENIARYDAYPLWQFLPKMLALAEKTTDKGESFSALCWVTEQARSVGVDGRRILPFDNRALTLLLRDHRNNPEIGAVCQTVAQYQSPAREAFLRAILEPPVTPETRALATFALAKLLAARRHTHLFRKIMPKAEGALEIFFEQNRDPDHVESEQRADPDKLFAEAEALYESVRRESPDQRYRYPTSRTSQTTYSDEKLGDLSDRALFQLRFLSPDRMAPDASGKDLDGRQFSLSDHRGKVVVLTFWFSTCGPCLQAMKDEKKLMDRLTGRPLVLLGVNSGDGLELARETAAEHDATWPSLWDGEKQLTNRWNVTHWPTTYVVDHRGKVVVESDPRSSSFPKLIERLVEAAEMAAQ